MTFDTLDTEQFTQELQFLGSFGERFDYLVGLYYFKEEGDHFQHIDIDLGSLPPAFVGPIFIDKDRDIDAESTSEAVFAQVTWTPAILDDRLGADVRWPLHEDNREATRTTELDQQLPRFTGITAVEPDSWSIPLAAASTRTSASSTRRSPRTWRGRRM